MRYIDVSEWQGAIDWAAVRGHIDGAILRAGYGAGHPDKQFARNVSECSRLGIPCGAYWFSYAWTPEMAAAEARQLLDAVRPYRMELPLCFDFEYDSVRVAAREGGVTVDRALATAMVRAFCETVEAGGYYALFYANPDYLARYFDADLPRRFGLWLAQWPAGAPDVTRPPRACAVWQWTSTGTVPGVAGAVDVNEAYSDFAALIRAAGINGLGAGNAPFACEGICDLAAAGGRERRGANSAAAPLAGRPGAGTGMALRQGGKGPEGRGDSDSNRIPQSSALRETADDSSLSQREPPTSAFAPAPAGAGVERAPTPSGRVPSRDDVPDGPPPSQSPDGDSSPIGGAGTESAEPLASPIGGAGTESAGPLASPIGGAGTESAEPLASPSGGGAPAGGGEGPFSAAVAWARAAGILPEGLAPTDTPTLAAVAEMFYQFRK